MRKLRRNWKVISNKKEGPEWVHPGPLFDLVKKNESIFLFKILNKILREI